MENVELSDCINAIDILVVEDDTKLADLTARYLKRNGFSVSIVNHGGQAVDRIKSLTPRLIVLDLMLPGKDGISICKEIRSFYRGPVLMLTAKETDLDQVIGLEAGADDYVKKPVEPMVLLARIRTLMRRVPTAADASIANSIGFSGAKPDRRHAFESSPSMPKDIILGGLCIRVAAQEVWLNGELIPMTTHEFELLCLLAGNSGTILSRETLFKKTRGIDYNGLDRSIDVRISRLRKKLNDDAQNPFRIKTVWGKGYLVSPDAW